MNVEIINPDKLIYEGEASLVQLPGKDGSFEILNNHAPLISILAKGKVKILNKNKETEFFEIKGGLIEVLKNKVLILAE
ncbi:MAG: ATP synthase F1 subunit epsilon [Bacteroidetes bacterium]|nr:MAG: ATP synthase F1 subunit epsilon [Bacteroidota bacterium]